MVQCKDLSYLWPFKNWLKSNSYTLKQFGYILQKEKNVSRTLALTDTHPPTLSCSIECSAGDIDKNKRQPLIFNWIVIVLLIVHCIYMVLHFAFYSLIHA